VEPETCSDPVSGTWVAHVYYDHVGDWYQFTLNLELEGGEVRGAMRAGWWTAGPTHSKVPVCGDAVLYRAVEEPLSGSWSPPVLDLSATSWRISEASCRPVRVYLLDNFKGAVQADLQEFQSLLNADAPEWRDVPTVFRRVACAGAPKPKSADPVVDEPPPFHPPVRGIGWRGCGG
jgi:hypothetical protein